MDRSPVRGAARLAAILDSLPEALLLVDAGGRIVNANAVALGWFEAGGPALVGRAVTDFLSGYGAVVARLGESSGGVWTDPGVAEQSAEGAPERMVARRADGSAFPAEIVRSTLPPMHGGLEVLVVRDVSGVADSEQELRRQQRQTELILRATSEGIVGVDTGGRIVMVNPAAARILGYRASELGGREFHTMSSTGVSTGGADGPGGLSPADRAPDTESPVLDTLRTGRKHRLGAEAGVFLHAKDGTMVPVELATAPVLESEALVGAVVTFVDLSRFRAPAVRPGAGGQGANGGNGAGKDSAIGPEAISALRRPIDAARAELGRLADSAEGLSPSTRHHLAHVTAELAEAARLVDDLLDAATGLSGLRKRPAELGRIVHAAVDAATDLAAAAGIDLAVHTGPAEVVIDAERMTQAVRHLLVDTVHASPAGSTVVVAAARRGSVARIEIRGAEIGNVPEHLDFARVVVERHAGTVSVHRVEGKGVTYVIELPAGTPQESGPAPSAALGRNLADETRIIPMIREIGPALAPKEPADDVFGGRRRGAVLSAAGSGGSAAIPRQGGRVEEAPAVFVPEVPNWFDGERGYGPPVERPTTAAAEPASRPDEAVSPRGRRRAAGQQGSDDNGYLVGGVSFQPVGAYQESDSLIHQVRPYGPALPANGVQSSLYSVGSGSASDPAESRVSDLFGSSLSASSSSSSALGASSNGVYGNSDPGSSGFRNPPTADSLFGSSDPGSSGFHDPLSSTGSFGSPPAAEPAAPRAWPNPDEPDVDSWPATGVQPTLLVWPAPEPQVAQFLQAQGYTPMALKTPNQLTEPGPDRPVALLADPVGVPVTRAALHTLRAAAADSGIPLFVTAGLGAVPAAALAATARRGADPSALLRALTPEQVPAPRVLLVEENPDLAAAFAISLERDGMRVLQAASENDAVTALAAEQPQLVVMNLTLVRRRRSGVVDWLRAYERLHLAPTVLYTVPVSMTADVELLRALRSGTAAVHLTDREIGQETSSRLLDLMGKVAD